MKIYCATNHFTALKFLGPHNKSHGVRGLGKYYHMHFNSKLEHGTCIIRRIPSAFTLCNFIPDHTWISGMPAQQQTRCQHVQYFIY